MTHALHVYACTAVHGGLVYYGRENIIYNTKQYKMKWYRVKQYMRIECNN